MAKLSYLPTPQAAQIAWERFQSLAHEANANRILWEDLEHCKAMARAWDAWRDIFLKMDSAA